MVLKELHIFHSSTIPIVTLQKKGIEYLLWMLFLKSGFGSGFLYERSEPEPASNFCFLTSTANLALINRRGNSSSG